MTRFVVYPSAFLLVDRHILYNIQERRKVSFGESR